MRRLCRSLEVSLMRTILIENIKGRKNAKTGLVTRFVFLLKILHYNDVYNGGFFWVAGFLKKGYTIFKFNRYALAYLKVHTRTGGIAR